MKPPKYLLFALSLIICQAEAASSIGINFVDGGDNINNGAADSLASGESAGVSGYSQSNWNNLGRWGNNVTVVDSTSATTTVNLTWDALGTWTNGASLATGDGKLMSGYLDPTYGSGANTAIAANSSIFGQPTNNKPVTFVGGISSWLGTTGSTTYSVLIYFDGDTFDNGRIGEFWLESVSGNAGEMTSGGNLTSHLFGLDSSNFAGVYSQVSGAASSIGAAEAGNYLIFSGLSADQFLLRSDEAVGYASDAIAGFQIIADPIPEPATTSVAALGLSALLLRRRRA